MWRFFFWYFTVYDVFLTIILLLLRFFLLLFLKHYKFCNSVLDKLVCLSPVYFLHQYFSFLVGYTSIFCTLRFHAPMCFSILVLKQKLSSNSYVVLDHISIANKTLIFMHSYLSVRHSRLLSFPNCNYSLTNKQQTPIFFG